MKPKSWLRSVFWAVWGGMGRMATVDFLGKLTRLPPATCDQDHLPWVTVSQPGIPRPQCRHQGRQQRPRPLPDQMQAASLQGWRRQWLKRSNGPIGAIAILAIRGTVQAGVYSDRLQANGFDLAAITEDEQTVVDKIIKDVKGGRVGPARDAMRVLLQTLAGRGVKTAILGCTELPIAHIVRSGDPHSGVQAIDTSLALATVSLRRLGYL